jgi:hypothetical protein
MTLAGSLTASIGARNQVIRVFGMQNLIQVVPRLAESWPMSRIDELLPENCTPATGEPAPVDLEPAVVVH